MTETAGQLGINPHPYDISKFEVTDLNGRLITNARIEELKLNIRAIASNIPYFVSYSKEIIDSWLQQNLVGEGDEASQALISEYIAVVSIKSGFFTNHNILIKNAVFTDDGRLVIDYGVTDAEGKAMNRPEALESIVQNIAQLFLYEEVLADEINQERQNRENG